MLWKQFDGNEIWLILLLGGAYTALFLLPQKFTRQTTVISLLWGFTIGMLFDFTIGGGLIDLYMVNDTNQYEVFDMMYYFLYAPFGYFFFYYYETWAISKKTFIPYVIAWSIVGVCAMWLFSLLNILVMQKGFQALHAFPIFLITQTITGLYYEKLKSSSVPVKSGA